MAQKVAFILSLILLTGCAPDSKKLSFTGLELEEYSKIINDYEAPEYKWGYINKRGELVIENTFDDLREFNEGLAAASVNGLWGYIDKNGIEVIPMRFRKVQTFSDGIAIAENLVGSFHFFDNKGQSLVDSLDFDEVYKFADGLALVNQSYLFGFINKAGQIEINPIYESATNFSNGLSIVYKNGKAGIIDIQGEIVIPLNYDKIWHPVNGISRFKNGKTFGFINTNTKALLFNGFVSATDFIDGRALVNDGNQYLLLEESSKKIPLPYTYVDIGGEGKWMYAADARFGFLNNDGSVLCLPQYDLVMRYRENRSGFAIDDVWGYLDETGKIAIPPQYPLVWDFVGGYARMISRYGFGFIDPNNNQVLPPNYMEVRDFSEGLARIQVY